MDLAILSMTIRLEYLPTFFDRDIGRQTHTHTGRQAKT